MKDRTKVDISTALTTLLAKKAIDDITVREIVELYDIRRQIFCTAIRESRICRLRSRTLSSGRIPEYLSVCFWTGSAMG